MSRELKLILVIFSFIIVFLMNEALLNIGRSFAPNTTVIEPVQEELKRLDILELHSVEELNSYVGESMESLKKLLPLDDSDYSITYYLVGMNENATEQEWNHLRIEVVGPSMKIYIRIPNQEWMYDAEGTTLDVMDSEESVFFEKTIYSYEALGGKYTQMGTSDGKNCFFFQIYGSEENRLTYARKYIGSIGIPKTSGIS